jgi:undecaprenyl-phosphate galactose phosphotransferase
VLTESLVRARVPFAAMPRLGALPVLGVERTAFFSHDTVMLQYRNNLARPVARALKVTFDLIAASILLLLALPVLLVLAALVRIDGGPALYAHRRIGANGRAFDCLKFRSMVVDADAVLHRLLANDAAAAAEWADTHKLRNDPRITRIGRFLRATSLDELPQLLNILRLDMSLVGPRPIVRAEIGQYGEDIAYYYETRPGLTGLWQVSGRSDTSYAHRVHLDTWYAKNWTVWHDIAILAKTVPAVLKREGAV